MNGELYRFYKIELIISTSSLVVLVKYERELEEKAKKGGTM